MRCCYGVRDDRASCATAPQCLPRHTAPIRNVSIAHRMAVGSSSAAATAATAAAISALDSQESVFEEAPGGEPKKKGRFLVVEQQGLSKVQ